MSRSLSDQVLPLPLRRRMLEKAFARLANQVLLDAAVDEWLGHINALLARLLDRERGA